MLNIKDIKEEDKQSMYQWIDDIPLSRVKRNIARDFSDGCLLAEVIHHFHPNFVELHNYISTSNSSKKLYNWKTLNRKVLSKIGATLSDETIRALTDCEHGEVEKLLFALRPIITSENLVMKKKKIDKRKNRKIKKQDTYSNDSHDNSINHHSNNYSPQVTDNNDHNDYPIQSMKKSRKKRYNDHSPVRKASHSKDLVTPAVRLPVLAKNKIVEEKDAIIQDLQETVELLQIKIQKLEQLVGLKDAKVEKLKNRLNNMSNNNSNIAIPKTKNRNKY